VQNLRTGARHSLDLRGTAPRFVPPDRLVFNRGRQLFSVGFDPVALRVTGAPTAVLDDVASVWNTGAVSYDISAGGTLVFPGVADAGGLGMAVAAGGGERALPVARRGYTAPIVASSGRFVAVEVVEESDDIWVIDLQGGTPQRLTFNDEEDETPVWSPDDRWVAYASTRESSRQILRRRADGGGSEEVLWKGQEHIHVHDWTPDGRYLLTGDATDNTRSPLGLLDLHASPPAMRPIMGGPVAVRSAHLTRDGRWIAYASAESESGEVYVQDFPRLTARWQVSQGGGLNPMWTGDGRALYYRRGATLYRVPVTPAGTALRFGSAVEVVAALPAVKGSHRAFAVLPEGDALVLAGTANDRGTYLNLFQGWTSAIVRGAAAR
jgi:dipeptidyl aminopeptidase/acylaminoacyl peptidase